jgi:hypothetical protein
VRALEVWDVPVQGRLFYEQLGSSRIEAERERGLSEDEIDEALAEALARGLEVLGRDGRCPKPELLFLGGGLTEREGFRERVRVKRLASEVRWSPSPSLPGLQGARARLGARGGMLLELGQTSLKVARIGSESESTLLHRDLGALPLFLVEHGPVPAEIVREQSERLSSWLASALVSAIEQRRDVAPTLVLALPCSLDDQGSPGLCSYAGLAEGASFPSRWTSTLGSLLPRGHPWSDEEMHVEVLAVNDAELFGASALAMLESEARSGLALTLGFGPGGAWFQQEN